jgi:hypothetical protein
VEEAFSKPISFGKALSSNQIAYQVTAEQLDARRMKLSVQNKSHSATEIQLETGRIFFPENDDIQPFVVTKGFQLDLEPNESRTFWVQARCGNSGANTPSSGTKFTSTKMGSEQLVSTLVFMNQQKISSTSLYQNVVWHYTNNHQLASITAGDIDAENQRAVLQQICKASGKSPAWYSLTYQESENGDDMSFSGNPKQASGKLVFINPTRENIQVQLTDSTGKLLNTLELFVNYPEGKTEIPFQLDLQPLKKGNYTVKVVNTTNTILGKWDLDVS